MTVFSSEDRALFAAMYPEVPHKLHHRLGRHPLLEIDALARLAEALPATSIEYNKADLPIGITEKPEILGRTLIFVGLAEGIAIYGLIISFMILNA